MNIINQTVLIFPSIVVVLWPGKHWKKQVPGITLLLYEAKRKTRTNERKTIERIVRESGKMSNQTPFQLSTPPNIDATTITAAALDDHVCPANRYAQ